MHPLSKSSFLLLDSYNHLFYCFRQTEPTFKHFDVRTVNGIYTPDEHYRQVTYMDLMQGKDSMTLLVIDGDLYDFISK